MTSCKTLFAALALSGVLFLGCTASKPEADNANDAEKSSSGIIGKTTQDIQEYDASRGEKVSDGAMKTPSPLNPLGAMNAYGPTVEKISKMGIKRAVDLFYAEHGRYPKDFDEFMSKIIKANNFQLPVLPGGAEYRYDVEKHELIIVKPDDSDKNQE